MSAIKDYLDTVMQLVEERRFGEALETLGPWGEDAPNQLWAVIEFLASDNPPETPSHFLPWKERSLITTPQDLREMAQYLENQGVTGMNVASVVDLLIWSYAVNAKGMN